MDRLVRLLLESHLSETLHDHLLRITLSGIDHVYDFFCVTEAMGRDFSTVPFLSGCPEYLPICLHTPWPVREILVEKPELPELISDVLPRVSHAAIGTNQDLIQALNTLIRVHHPSEWNNPAPFVRTFCFKTNDPILLKKLKGSGPETAANDI